jgi:hypothetical protein
MSAAMRHPMEPTPQDYPNPEIVQFMRDGGMSARAIARVLRLPYSRVLRWLRTPSNSAPQ